MRLIPNTDDVLHTDFFGDVFDFENPELDLKTVLPEMFDLMKQSNGVGLAAPQVGLPFNLFIMDFKGRKYTCINPSLIVMDGPNTVNSVEGCLSYPNLRLTIKRHQTIKASWQDEHGEAHEEMMEFDIGRIFQHEYDHIRGITFDTKVSKLKLNMAKRKMRKAQL